MAKKIAKQEEQVEQLEQIKTSNKQLSGTIVSDKMQKTVVVEVTRKVRHPVYSKIVKISRKIKADTNDLELKKGDVVVIEQTRPISKGKSFKVVKKVG